MTRTLIVRAEAEADLVASKLWYEEQHDGLGARFISEVDGTFRRIETNPTAFGFVRGKLRRALLHRFPSLTIVGGVRDAPPGWRLGR